MTTRSRELRFVGTWRGTAVAVVLGVATIAIQPRLASQAPAPLTVERITSTPTLTGTPPSGVVWAPDGSRVAFLVERPGAAVQGCVDGLGRGRGSGAAHAPGRRAAFVTRR